MLILGTTAVNAVPAMKSWKKMILSDGTAVEVTLVGDEYAHYYITRNGRTLAPRADGKLAPVSAVQIANMAFLRQTAMANAMQRLSFARQAKAAPATKGRNTLCRLPSIVDKTIFRGSKKAPVILAYFSDKKFSKSDEQIVKFYDNVLNKEGFNEYGAAGSVHDYFKDMSRGVFDLTFDIIGPVKVSKSATYYGGPSVIMGGTDHIGEFITEAVKTLTQLTTSIGRNTTGTAMAKWNRCLCCMLATDRLPVDQLEQYGPTPGLSTRQQQITTVTEDSLWMEYS